MDSTLNFNYSNKLALIYYLVCCSLQEFKRTKGNINSMREHAELLGSVRDDITDFKVNHEYDLNLITLIFLLAVVDLTFSGRHRVVCHQGCSYYARELPSMEVYLM